MSARVPLPSFEAARSARTLARCCFNKAGELEKLARQKDQRQALTIALAMNAVMFLLEFGAGVYAGSASLMADSADIAGGALVYGLSLYALNKTDRWRNGAAVAKGSFILILGLAVLAQVGVRLTTGVAPTSSLMP